MPEVLHNGHNQAVTTMTIHPSAIISDKSSIGQNVQIGPFCIIHDHVKIGDGTRIDAYSEIGIHTPLAISEQLSIGKNSVIRSHAVIYTGSTIGEGLQTGHNITIRENSLIGKGFQLGSRGDVQGDCEIGDFSRTHADVHIGKKSKIGDYVWLFPEVLLTNDPTPPSEDLIGVTIEDFVVIASKSLVMPGVNIGRGAVIAAGSIVTSDIAPEKLARGNPAKEVCNANVLRMHSDPRIKAYPWNKRFHRGYPEESVSAWIKK